MEHKVSYRKKLIEVALPLEEINKQSSREKSIRHGHPSTLHLWWARRPLAACRAVLFASLVDDPGEYLPEKEAEAERQRLFRLIERLVNWDNVNNEKLLAQARLEIARSVARNLGVETPIDEAAICEFLAEKAPPVLDPFCGGGSIPLEAQRLGLRAYASDLNPVAVLITKALIEIPPKFANRPPVHPPEKNGQTNLAREWRDASGLAEDVRYYGKWMRDEAEKRIGHLYPKVKLPKEYGGGEAKVIAWLWARTVKCPNPACGAMMPLVRSFWLSTKKGRKAWVQPVVDRRKKAVRFEVKTGEGELPAPPKIGRGAKFRCLVCEETANEESIRDEFKAKHNDQQLMAIVAEANQGRIYLPPNDEHIKIANSAEPKWKPTEEMNQDTPNLVSGRGYGITHWHELFTSRQLTALTTFSDLVSEARSVVRNDAVAAGLADDGVPLNEGGAGAQAYAEAVATYLAFASSKLADRNSTIASWDIGSVSLRSTFARQALPMVWDFCEANPFENMGSFDGALGWIGRVLILLPTDCRGIAWQSEIISTSIDVVPDLISTDPPYYDNIGYADLSDFFYIWLRRSLSSVYPDLFSTVLVPKTQELVATPYRFSGSKEKAQRFFEEGLRQAFARMREVQHHNYPLTVYYAFKQSESEDEMEESENGESTVASTGWETMLEGLLTAGFSVTGTWPMRSELSNRPVASGTNALASSIVLVCRSRPEDASPATRREFLNALKRELPPALKQLQQGAIAPVDLAQAAIGPGMAVFSRYSKVLEADGTPMRVRTALALINQALDEFFAEQEGEFDSDTRWALAWFEQFGHNEGPFGVAETLSKAKNTSIEGLVRAGVLQARGGKVRLLKREEFDSNWTPESGGRSVWEATQYLIRALDNKGEEAAANLLRRLQSTGEIARDLAYRLYSICERKGWAQEALAYNMLATAWPRLMELAGRSDKGKQEALL
jgi:putative DNA methylase